MLEGYFVSRTSGVSSNDSENLPTKLTSSRLSTRWSTRLSTESIEPLCRLVTLSCRALQDNVTSLQSGSIDSVDSLVDHRVLSRDDVNLVGKFSESLEETPDVLETKYPSNILVVDDNPANTEYLRRKLLAAKHSVLVANSGPRIRN